MPNSIAPGGAGPETAVMRLLEREHILDVLSEYAHETRAGEGRLVLVNGEAGVGKSSLVDRFRLDHPDARWAAGACDGLFTPRALGPLFEIAEQLGGELLEACRRSAPRDELFAVLLRQLEAADELTVLCIEDLHWADESTLDLLRFLGRRIRTTRTVLLATYRDDSLSVDHALRIVVGELGTERTTRRVAVPPLTERGVAALAEGTALPAGELHRLTGGNPFFVSEIIACGIAGVPASARDAVLARTARLSPSARAAIEVAALVGTKVEPRLLDAGGVSSADLDELVAGGMLQSEDEALRFRHELARIAVADQIPTHRRVEIHARLLAALRRAGVEDHARLAFHADGAGDREAVLLFAPSAGDRASELGAHREAAAQFERALRYSPGCEPSCSASLYARLAHEASLIDRWDLAAEAGERALQLWHDVGNRLRESCIAEMLSRTMWRLCRGERSAVYARQAVETVRELGPTPELARALASLGTAEVRAGNHTRALELLREAARMAERLQVPDALSDALNTEACLLFDAGGDWEPVMERAIQVAQHHGVVSQAGRGYANLHVMYAGLHRFADADRIYHEGSVYCDEHDIATFGTCLRSGQGEIQRRRGRWNEAAELAQGSLAAGASPANRITPLLTLARIEARRGEDGAGERVTEAVRLTEQSGDRGWVVEAYPARAEIRWLTGDHPGARDDLAVAADAAGTADNWVRGTIADWQRRLGLAPTVRTDDLPAPFARALAGDHAGAAAAWDELECPYEAALALLDAGTEESLRAALRRFEALGAAAAAQLTRREMRRRGLRAVPTGAQPATRAHPAGLTRREREVLEFICAGRTNGEISEHLVISLRTVDHHVSSVLAKLGVPSRRAAATEAARLGLVGGSHTGRGRRALI
jgi:ATP/maltotriose-dependent transcriptional regulator MalT